MTARTAATSAEAAVTEEAGAIQAATNRAAARAANYPATGVTQLDLYMEGEELFPMRSSSLKRGREKADEEYPKHIKRLEE